MTEQTHATHTIDGRTYEIVQRQHTEHSARHYAMGDDLVEAEIREGGPAATYYTVIERLPSGKPLAAVYGNRYPTARAAERALTEWVAEPMTQTMQGRLVASTEVFEEGGFWRWRITMADGTEYLDGGNYRTEEAARSGLRDALDT